MFLQYIIKIRFILYIIKVIVLMKYTYNTKGVCATQIEMELNGETIEKIEILRGCDGNLQGITKLIEGQNAREVAKKLQGVKCGSKSTSCPDQISKALTEALEHINDSAD